jgi:hypothetical protein
MDDANVPVSTREAACLCVIHSISVALVAAISRFFEYVSTFTTGRLLFDHCICLDKTDPVYVKTKKMILSRKNPYYAKGATFFGTG